MNEKGKTQKTQDDRGNQKEGAGLRLWNVVLFTKKIEQKREEMKELKETFEVRYVLRREKTRLEPRASRTRKRGWKRRLGGRGQFRRYLRRSENVLTVLLGLTW